MGSMTTVSGETWDMLAYRAYGDESRMSVLIEANYRHRQTALFGAGVVLAVPELPAAKAASLLPPWKR